MPVLSACIGGSVVCSALKWKDLFVNEHGGFIGVHRRPSAAAFFIE
jgi:hypothetical protein